VPIADPRVETTRRRIILRGDVPSPVNPPSGCRFHTRCWLRRELDNPERCVTEDPMLRELRPAHAAACHFSEELIPLERRTKLVEAASAHSSALDTAPEDLAQPLVTLANEPEVPSQPGEVLPH
jgi:oligopeptide/dipeptide ABC transporter ATP-binding protein